MKLFTNKNLIQKLIIAIVIVTLLNFCMAPSVHAEFGGLLMSYIRQFVTALADVTISVVQMGLTGEWTYAVDKKGSGKDDGTSEYWIKPGKFQYPIIQVSPELIFADEIETLSIDFIGGNDEAEDDYIIKSEGNVIGTLRSIIASWYVTLRTMATVGLLSVLIYIGIRIIISSTSQDRAKYKQRLIDWLVAFCLLFFMHFIMAGIINIVDRVNDTLADACKIETGIELNEDYGKVYYDYKLSSTDNQETPTYLLWNEVEGTMSHQSNAVYVDAAPYVGWHSLYDVCIFHNTSARPLVKTEVSETDDVMTLKYTIDDGSGATMTVSLNTEVNQNGDKLVKSGTVSTTDESRFNIAVIQECLNINSTDGPDDGGDDEPLVTTTDPEIVVVPSSRGDVRVLKSALEEEESEYENGSRILYFINYARLYLNVVEKDEYIPQSVGYLIIYIVLIVYTVMFAIRYMKRVVYIAFLTLMAPMVALTYPLDKIRDGKAQAFNMWFKEYIFNVIIQPFHLLLYTVLIGTAMELASTSMIYAIVAIGFLTPAEKLLRKFFGFDNAGTLSAAGSFAGGALFSSVINKINRPKPKDESEDDKNGKGGNRPVRKSSSGAVNADKTLIGSGNSKAEGSPNTSNRDTQQKSSDGQKVRSAQASGDTQRNMQEGETGGKQEDKPEEKPPEGYKDHNGLWVPEGLPEENQTTPHTPEEVQSANNVDIHTPKVDFAGNENKPEESAPVPVDVQLTKGEALKNRVNGYVNRAKGHIFRDQEEGRPDWMKSKKITVRDRMRDTEAISDAARAVGYRYATKLKNGAKTLPKKFRRVAVGGTVGAGLAITGAAVGIASGDPSKAAQYAAAAGVAGYYGSNYYGDKAAKEMKETSKEAGTAFWGEKAKQRQQYQYDKKFKSDPENINALAKALGSRNDAKAAMKDGRVQALLNAGITDPGKMGKALKLQKEYMKPVDTDPNKVVDPRHKGLSSQDALQRAVSVAVWNKNAGSGIYETNSRARNSFIRNTMEEIKEKDPNNYNEEKARSHVVDDILRDMEYFEE